MTAQSQYFVAERPATATILVEGARCWREASDSGRAVQPSLYRLLAALGCGMLAPVLDSLMTLWEGAFGRRFDPGEERISEDERLLLELLDTSGPLHGGINWEEGRALALRCAIISTRIMLKLVKKQPEGRPALMMEASPAAG